MSTEQLRQMSANALNELKEDDRLFQIFTHKVNGNDIPLLIGILENDGMVDDGASEVLREQGNYIWNKAALYELAKEIQAHEPN